MSFCYLATPYTKYPGGIEAAYQLACSMASEMLLADINTFSPIVHAHAIATATGMNSLDHEFWMAIDFPFLDAAKVLVVGCAEGWDESLGVQQEMAYFLEQHRSIIRILPESISQTYILSQIKEALACAT
jgi:hypothetical protein